MPVAMKRGRPKKPKGESRPNKLTIALTDEELDALEAYCRKFAAPPNRSVVIVSALREFLGVNS